MAIEWTEHAKTRAAERFADRSLCELEGLYLRAKRIGKGTRKKLRANNPIAWPQFIDGPFKGRFARMTRCGIVFIVAAPETIVTIFHRDMNDA